jgi:Ca2+-transporting ATPase
VTDVFPAIALGLGEADPEIMNRSPRDSQESILTSSHWTSIGIHGLTIALSVTAALTLALKGLKVSLAHAVTISFLTLGFARVWNVFNMREKGSDLFKNEVTINPYIWGSVVICTGLLLAAVYIPGLNNALKLMNPMVKGWSIILGASLVPLVIGQAQKGIHRILS